MPEWLQMELPWWQIVLRGTLVFFALVLFLRLAGKRTAGQFTPFDLLVLVLLGDAVQGSMLGGDTSLPGGLILAFTLLAWSRLTGFATARSDGLAAFIEGHPEILARNGRIFHDALRSADLTLDDLQEAMREHGCVSIGDVRLAVLEKDGTITVLKRGAKQA